MTVSIPAAVVFSVFFLIAAMTFYTLLNVWTQNSQSLQELAKLHAQRLNTSISITSAGPTETDLDCNNFTSSAQNSGEEAIIDLTDGDLLVEYADSSGNKVASYLTYATTAVTGNRWTTTGFINDIRNPSSWDPQETATFKFSIDPAMGASATGPVLISSPLGVTDSEYFVCPNHLYFHSETNTIASTDYFQLRTDFTSDGTATTVSAPFPTLTTGRVRPTTNSGKSTLLLTETATIPAATWTATYRARRDKADFGFVWFTNAIDVSVGVTGAGSWNNIDLSPHIPTTATGAIIEVVNSGVTSDYSGVVRGTADTTDYLSNLEYERMYASSHRWQIVKVDSSRKIDGYIENIEIDFKLLGYTIGNDPAYFNVPPDITPTTTAAWTTVDVSANVDADATGVILLVDSIDAAQRSFGVRETGSSFATTNRNLGAYGNTMYLVGIDGSDRFDAYIENSNVKIYLVGQTKESVVFYTDTASTDGFAVTDPTLASWQPIDADTYAVSGAAVGMLFWAENADAAGDHRISFREGDSTDNWNGALERGTQFQGAVGINSTNIWSEFMSNASINVSAAGYTRLVRMDSHADLDILVRQGDGTVRATIATNAANSGAITSASWQTFTATYSFAEYPVLAATDYLEIDLFAEATVNTSGEDVSVEFRIDDPTLAAADQTRVTIR